MTTAVGGFDLNADILTQSTTLPAALNQAFTICGWFYRTTHAADGMPFSIYTAGGAYNRMLVNTSGNLRVGSNIGGTNVAAIALNTWYFFAMVQAGGGSPQVTGYAAAEGASSLSSASVASISDSGAIAGMKVGGSESFATQIQGGICEYRLWTRALSAAEVLAEFLSSTPVSPTNLIGRWPLESAATRLTAAVGTNLTDGTGSWTTITGPTWPALVGEEFAAAGAASATGSAALTTSITCAAAGAASASGTASLRTGALLAGSASASASGAASLSTSITLAGAAEARATGTAFMSGVLPTAALYAVPAERRALYVEPESRTAQPSPETRTLWILP